MYYRKEPVHLIWNFLEVRWNVVAHIDWFLAIPAPKLGNIRDRNVVQGPQSILVERLDSLFETNFDAIGQQIVLAQEILLLNLGKELRIVLFSNRHRKDVSQRRLIFREAFRTLSLVISSESRALPNAKLILCSCNSSSVTGLSREASSNRSSCGSAGSTF